MPERQRRGAAILRRRDATLTVGALGRHIAGETRDPTSAPRVEADLARDRLVELKPTLRLGPDRREEGAELIARFRAQPRGRGRPPAVGVELLMTGPPPWDAPDAWALEDVLRWGQAGEAWARRRIDDAGLGVVTQVTLHQDERSPHLHVAAVPVQVLDDGTLRMSKRDLEEGLAGRTRADLERADEAAKDAATPGLDAFVGPPPAPPPPRMHFRNRARAIQTAFHSEVGAAFGLERGVARPGLRKDRPIDRDKGLQERARAAEWRAAAATLDAERRVRAADSLVASVQSAARESVAAADARAQRADERAVSAAASAEAARRSAAEADARAAASAASAEAARRSAAEADERAAADRQAAAAADERAAKSVKAAERKALTVTLEADRRVRAAKAAAAKSVASADARAAASAEAARKSAAEADERAAADRQKREAADERAAADRQKREAMRRQAERAEIVRQAAVDSESSTRRRAMQRRRSAVRGAGLATALASRARTVVRRLRGVAPAFLRQIRRGRARSR